MIPSVTTRRAARLRLGGALGLALMLRATAPRAQEAPVPDPPPGDPDPAQDHPQAPEGPSIVPPSPTTSIVVAYPEGASGSAIVVLTVTVNADGTVRSTSVASGDEPFATAAKDAAATWRFEPAMRDGRPVAATIRFEVRFTEPAKIAPEKASAEKAAVTGAVPAELPEEPAEGKDIVVHGKRIEPGVSSFNRAEVRQLPGAFGDPFRAVEALPGVTPIASGVPFFYVRGAPPGNVGYFLDGVRVPYLYHIGLGPSVVHPGLVERVDLYPGGYPAAFGRFAGGIVAGETTAPRSDLHGEGNVRVFDAGALVESGFADGRGTVLLGGRYSYTAAILSLVAEDVTLDYRDFQARASYDLTPDDRVTVFAFGAYDLLGREVDGVLDVLFGSEFYRLDLRYDHFFDEASRVRTAVTLGFDQTRIAQTRNALDRMVAGRVEIDHPVSDTITVRAGTNTTADVYGTGAVVYRDPDDPDAAELEELFPSRTDLAIGAYADAVLRVTPSVEVIPGLRADVYTSEGATAIGIDPRIAARFAVTDDVRIMHAYGLAHQPPSFVVPIPGLTPSDLEGGLQQSFQTSAGVEVDLPAEITASATVFHNAFFDMTDALGTSSGELEGGLVDRSLGSSMGLEIFVRRRLTESLGGFLSYTLSRSMRSVGREEFPSAFDRTHVGNAALAYDLGKRWRAGTRLVAYSGVPESSPTSGLLVAPRPTSPPRSPPFYRVDLRLEKSWPIGRAGWIATVFEVLNATLSKETFGSTTGSSDTIGPVTIPSIGVEGGF